MSRRTLSPRQAADLLLYYRLSALSYDAVEDRADDDAVKQSRQAKLRGYTASLMSALLGRRATADEIEMAALFEPSR